MSRILTIDFVHMPWARAQASWRHYGAGVWSALQAAVRSSGPAVHIVGEASAHAGISGRLKVSASGFTASVTVQGMPVKLSDEEAAHFFEDVAVQLISTGNEVQAVVRADFGETEKGREELILKTLWDLQLFMIRFKQEVAGMDVQ